MNRSPGGASFAPRVVEAGGWAITALSDGFFRLDGGSMWGVVPKALWQAWTPAAADNTIRLALRPFLARRGELCVVVEPGVGGRWSEKLRGLYAIERQPTLQDTLAAAGVAPADVTHVVATHCHWDHIGAWVVARPGGGLAPLFANARHFAPRIEVEMAQRPGTARAASYRAEDVEPLLELGLLETFEGETELLPSLRVHVLGGHSDGVSLVTFGEREAGDTAVFWSDVVPTSHHIQPPYIMAYDIDVVRSFDVRSTWIARAADEGWIGLFYHDEQHAFGRIGRSGRRFAFEPLARTPSG